MRGAGEERVILALCSAPSMRAKALLKALPFLIKENAEKELHRVYVADSLRMIAMNTANFASGTYPQERFYDLVKPRKIETRTEEEIIAHVFSRGWGVKN